MLGGSIVDTVESGAGTVSGLGLLPVSTSFEPDKLLRRRSGACPWLRTGACGYEIRHGRVHAESASPLGPDGAGPLFEADDGERDGARDGSVLGTSWHGALEHDGFRRALLGWVAGARGRAFVPGPVPFAEVRERRLDALGDLVERNLDTMALRALIDGGVPDGLPTLNTEVISTACSAS
jgi:adenosylcobyric acid synthase